MLFQNIWAKERRFTGFADMFGFKLEATRREGGVDEKARPIYLDMQVRRDELAVADPSDGIH